MLKFFKIIYSLILLYIYCGIFHKFCGRERYIYYLLHLRLMHLSL